jgi:hypothetical protein
MTKLLTKTELLNLPTLYIIKDLAPIITKFFNLFLGHLNLKDPVLTLSSMEVKVVKSTNSLTVSMPYSNTYDYYKVWNWAILYYNNLPNLLLVNDEAIQGPLVYLLGDVDITKTILYLLSQEMEVVQDGFAYNSFDGHLNYQNDPSDLLVLS